MSLISYQNYKKINEILYSEQLNINFEKMKHLTVKEMHNSSNLIQYNRTFSNEINSVHLLID